MGSGKPMLVGFPVCILRNEGGMGVQDLLVVPDLIDQQP